MRSVSAVVALFFAVLLAGCSMPDRAGLAGPDLDAALVATTAKGPSWTHRAVGGGSAMFGPVGLLQTGSVNVTRYSDGSLKGQFWLRSRIPEGQNALDLTQDLDIRAIADCFVAARDTAWISGPIVEVRRFDVPGIPAPVPGDPFMVIVTDSDDPAGGLAFFSPPFLLGVEDCRDRPVQPPVPPGWAIRGNYSIHER